jgi:hypothetical protein
MYQTNILKHKPYCVVNKNISTKFDNGEVHQQLLHNNTPSTLVFTLNYLG